MLATPNIIKYSNSKTDPLGDAGRRGRFGRGASLYRHQSQLFERLWVRLPLPTGQFLRFNSRPIMYGTVGTLLSSGVLGTSTWLNTIQKGIARSTNGHMGICFVIDEVEVLNELVAVKNCKDLHRSNIVLIDSKSSKL